MNALKGYIGVNKTVLTLRDLTYVSAKVATDFLQMDTVAMVNNEQLCIKMNVMITDTIPSLDIDECSEGIDRCDQNCHNSLGSYACSCDSGYRLDDHGMTCNGKT